MKSLAPTVAAALLLGLLSACQSRSEPKPDAFTPQTLVDSLAAAHGYGNWQDVKRLTFDFVVDVNDTTRTRRSWIWYPQRDSVVRIVKADSLAYVRSARMDSTATAADRQFINDTYWVLMPFYALWSAEGYTPTIARGEMMPLSQKPATRLTVAYAPQGGYTPGDAYDLYLDKDYVLREWTFRKGGQAEPSMITTWEDYRDTEGLLLPGDHRGEGPVRIHHTERSAVRAL